MLFARWQHHIRFGSGFPYAPLKAVLTKISKWSRIQDSFRITPKIESLVVFAIPNIPRKFQKDPAITFWVILLTHRQTDKQTKSGKNITSLAEVIMFARINELNFCAVQNLCLCFVRGLEDKPCVTWKSITYICNKNCARPLRVGLAPCAPFLRRCHYRSPLNTTAVDRFADNFREICCVR